MGTAIVVVWAGRAEAALPAVDGLQVLVQPPEIAIGGPSNGGSTVLELKNVGEKDLSGVSLRAHDFTSTLTKRKLGAQLLFAEASGQSGTVTYSLDLAAGKSVALQLLANGVWDAGEARAPVFVNGKPLLEVSARKEVLPFNLKLGGTGPIAVDWTTRKLGVRLENADALNYPIAWRLFIDGQAVAAASGNGTLPAAGAISLQTEIPQERFPDWWTGFLRSAKLPVTLVVEYADPTEPKPAPQRSLSASAQLDRHSAESRTFTGGGVALFLLILGGVTSLLLNHSVPNAWRRVGLRRQLVALLGKAKGLSAAIPSLLRMELRIQPLELTQRVDSELSFFPGAADVFAAAARDTTTLEQRIGLVSKIDDRFARIERMRAEGPPDLLHDQGRKLTRALRLLGTPAPDAAAVTLVEQTLTDVDAQLQRIEDEDEELRTAVLDEAKAFWSAWHPEWQQIAATAPAPDWLTMLRAQMSGFLVLAEQCFGAGNGARDQSLAALDTALSKLKLIASYVRACQTATPEQAERFDDVGRSAGAMPPEAQRTQRQRFFECLSGVGAHALNQAHLVLRQAQQGLFVKHLAEQIEHGKFRIEMEPQASVRALDPVRFRFVFFEDKFNGAAAREKLDCVWTFKHATGGTYEEHGWEASQAFMSPGERTVSVSICRGTENIAPKAEGGDLAKPLFERKIDVAKASGPLVRQRTQLELVQLGVALVVTMVALVSGAREQLEKLGLLASIAAVFALGFGADVVKNIISRRPSSPPGTPS